MNTSRYVRALKRCMLWMVLMTLLFSMNTLASSARSKAFKAYRNYLSKSRVYIFPKGHKGSRWGYHRGSYGYYKAKYKGSPAKRLMFAIAYIDKDNIPELIVRDQDWGGTLYKYSGGKLRRVLQYDYYEGISAYYERKSVIVERHSTEGTPYYEYYGVLKSRKSMVFGSAEHFHTRPIYYLKGRKKAVSKKMFDRAIKSRVGGARRMEMKWYENTAANRNILR